MPRISIVGGGPAGLSAAVYAVRAGLDVTVYYHNGGALEKTDQVENYFGFAQPVSGAYLLEEGRAQAARLGAKLICAEVTGIEYTERGFVVQTVAQSGEADAVILATGAPRAVPPVKGLAELEGRGVSYCAVCDAFFYRGKRVAVLGQGEYALAEAQTLLPVAGAVTLLTGGAQPPEKLPEGLWVDTRKVQAIVGDGKVESVTFSQGEPLAVDGVFIAYGTAGSADFARKQGALIDGNRIRIDSGMATNVPGLFAAGDCTGGLLQIAKAVYEGAQAAMSAIRYTRTQGKQT